MVATTFNILIFLISLSWFLLLCYRQSFGKYFIVTPFIFFGFNEILSLWGVPLNYAFKDKPLNGWELLVIGTAFLAFVTGFFLTGSKNFSFKSYLSQPITAKYHAQYYFMGVTLSTIFLVLLGLYYYQGAPALGFSVFELLMGNISLPEMSALMSEQRFGLTKSHWFGGEYRGQGIINVVQRIGWRFVFAISLIMYIKLKSKQWLFLSILTGLLLIMFQAGSGERAPLVFSVLFIIVVLSLMQKTSPRHFIILAALGFMFLMGTTYFSAKGGLVKGAPDFVSDLASQLVERIFLGNAIHDLEIMGFVESGQLDKRHGMYHIEKFVSSFPGIRMGEPLGYRVSYLRGSSEDVFSSGTYLGFVYADFGYSGVLITFFLIGFFLAYIQKQIFAMERDIILIVMSSMVIFYLAFIAASGFIGFASNMVMVVFFWGLFHFFGSIFSGKRASSQLMENANKRGDAI
ncbi:MAG: oligosaccharide repeat unit polymerase [Nitrospinales bacterium]|jgi:oligosaccharide repeat unit polymerase